MTLPKTLPQVGRYMFNTPNLDSKEKKRVSGKGLVSKSTNWWFHMDELWKVKLPMFLKKVAASINVHCPLMEDGNGGNVHCCLAITHQLDISNINAKVLQKFNQPQNFTNCIGYCHIFSLCRRSGNGNLLLWIPTNKRVSKEHAVPCSQFSGVRTGAPIGISESRLNKLLDKRKNKPWPSVPLRCLSKWWVACKWEKMEERKGK